jgi:hypothetical protein
MWRRFSLTSAARCSARMTMLESQMTIIMTTVTITEEVHQDAAVEDVSETTPTHDAPSSESNVTAV